MHVLAFAGRFTSQVRAVSGVSSACIVRVCARGCGSGERGCRGIKVLMLSVSLELRTNDEDDVDDVIGALWR